ncbi:hypothetical protein PMAYCL1PPCAC_07872, partial [Pristionchus mayeri]
PQESPKRPIIRAKTVHYHGPGRTWSRSLVYSSKEELKRSLIEKTMTISRAECRYKEAARIEENAREAVIDGYFEKEDMEKILTVCEEARKPPGDEELPFYVARWKEETMNTE